MSSECAAKDPHIGVSHGPGVFTDEEFERAAAEVTNPDLTDYEFFVESHGTKIYRHYKEVRGLEGYFFARILCSGLELRSERSRFSIIKTRKS